MKSMANSQRAKAAQAAAHADLGNGSAGGLAQVSSSSERQRAAGDVGRVATSGAVAPSAGAPTRTPVPTAAAATSSSSDGAENRLQGEVEHLERVRRLLTDEPAQALRSARQGQSAFAGGLFQEERAALIVFALARLERSEEALREAHVYLRVYPQGPFAVPVREIVTRFEKRRR